MTTYDLAADFMDMTNDRRVWTRLKDARSGFVPVAGRYVTVGSDDADAAVAKVLIVNADGHIQLQILPGTVDSNRDLLST